LLKLVLDGKSLLDWDRMYFEKREDVIAYLLVNEFDVNLKNDLKRLSFVYKNSIDYLKDVYGIKIPKSFYKKDIIDVMLLTSFPNKGRDFDIAFAILKVMNIINHVDSQELISKLSIESKIIIDKVKKKVMNHIEFMQKSEDFPDFTFEWSVKTRESIVSKFLTKKRGFQARIFDRVRFRMVTETKQDILPILYHLFGKLFSANNLIPTETKNTLLTINDKIDLDNPSSIIIDKKDGLKDNQFSGETYRVLNFIIDIPVRVDDIIVLPNDISFANHAYILYILTEVQILDKITAKNNEKGDNSHDLYKERQKKAILKRLSNALYKEKYGEE
jgi:uncharacterized protein (TIGR04552 family)